MSGSLALPQDGGRSLLEQAALNLMRGKIPDEKVSIF